MPWPPHVVDSDATGAAATDTTLPCTDLPRESKVTVALWPFFRRAVSASVNFAATRRSDRSDRVTTVVPAATSVPVVVPTAVTVPVNGATILVPSTARWALR